METQKQRRLARHAARAERSVFVARAREINAGRAKADLYNRDFPDATWSRRAGVCRRCHLIIHDFEPGSRTGEFWHKGEPHQTRARRCMNADQVLSTDSPELMPFLPKGRRRALRRMGITP